jgi:hypothetical protein
MQFCKADWRTRATGVWEITHIGNVQWSEAHYLGLGCVLCAHCLNSLRYSSYQLHAVAAFAFSLVKRAIGA